MRIGFLFGVVALSISLTACQIEPLLPEATVTSSDTETPLPPLSSLLPTIAVTDTVQPSPTPTAQIAGEYIPPEADSLLLRESFAKLDPAWQLGTYPQGAATIADGVLVLSVSQQYSTVISLLKKEVPADFYAEVTTRTVLCQNEKDRFGLAFRADDANGYRVAVTCNGSVRFERYAGNTVEGSNKWTAIDSFMTGAPAENRIGVLARGGLFRFFANGVEIFSYTDTILVSGNLGFFARTDVSEQLNVAFDNLAVYSLE